ncbi:MAG: SDR family oxidoreductase [Actinomycetota bacterium]|nr:SDR family oxidoreductase [Actinomycetota bacterium]
MPAEDSPDDEETPMTETTPRTVLITGASVGLGRLAALGLIEAGHTVVASMRDPGSRNAEAADALRSAGAHVVELDVTDDASVIDAVASAIDLVGRLDVVINNAGTGSNGLIETFTADDWMASFDVNVFGVHRVSRAVLPHMRSNGSGLVMIISSVAGRMALPFFGPYNAAKFAVEGLAETYRSELSMLGIETCIVEPGPFPTNFIDNLMPPSDRSREAGYGEMALAPQNLLATFEGVMASNAVQDPRNVADAIVALVGAPHGERPFRTIVDNLGMGDAVAPHNEGAGQMTAAIYGAFGMGHMLDVATAPA